MASSANGPLDKGGGQLERKFESVSGANGEALETLNEGSGALSVVGPDLGSGSGPRAVGIGATASGQALPGSGVASDQQSVITGVSEGVTPEGVRPLLVQRLSATYPRRAGVIADLVLQEGVQAAVSALASSQALETAAQVVLAAYEPMDSSAKPSGEFTTVGKIRKGSKRTRKRGSREEGAQTAKSHRGASGRGSIRGARGVGEGGRVMLHPGAVDRKMQTMVLDVVPDLEGKQLHRVSSRLLRMNRNVRDVVLGSADTLRLLATIEGLDRPAKGGYGRDEKKRDFGRQLYVKVLEFRTGMARQIVDALVDLPVDRLLTLLGSRAELESEVWRVCASLSGSERVTVRLAGAAKRGRKAPGKVAKRKNRASERRGVSGGTRAGASRSDNETNFPALTSAAKALPAVAARAPVAKGSAWENSVLGTEGLWVSRRYEDTSGDSDESDPESGKAQAVAMNEAASSKYSGPERLEDPALAEALEYTAGRNRGLFPGYVIRVQGSKVSVLHSRNEVITVRKPGKGRYAAVKFGDPVVLARKVKYVPGEPVSVSFVFASLKEGEKYEAPIDKLAVVKAVVLADASPTTDGEAVLPALGVKTPVPASRVEAISDAVSKLRLSGSEKARRGLSDQDLVLRPGSKFLFSPVFSGGKISVGTIIPSSVVVEANVSGCRLPATSVDICPGFLLPDSRIRGLVARHYQADAMPFVSNRRSGFALGLDADGVRQMMAAQSVSGQERLYHKRIVEAMALTNALCGVSGGTQMFCGPRGQIPGHLCCVGQKGHEGC